MQRQNIFDAPSIRLSLADIEPGNILWYPCYDMAAAILVTRLDANGRDFVYREVTEPDGGGFGLEIYADPAVGEYYRTEIDALKVSLRRRARATQPHCPLDVLSIWQDGQQEAIAKLTARIQELVNAETKHS